MDLKVYTYKEFFFFYMHTFRSIIVYLLVILASVLAYKASEKDHSVLGFFITTDHNIL